MRFERESDARRTLLSVRRLSATAARILAASLLIVGCAAVSVAASPAPREVGTPSILDNGQHDQPQPPAPHVETPQTTHGAERAEHAEGIVPTLARLLNFAVLAGVLVYFLRTPVRSYLISRSTQIRQDLVTAAEMRAAATAQLAQIEEHLRALPTELEALKVRGAEDVRAERQRIAQAAAAERDRLLAQTRREIETRLRIARRELMEYAAELAVEVARTRIARTITADDQLRLVDRYTAQLRGPQ